MNSLLGQLHATSLIHNFCILRPIDTFFSPNLTSFFISYTPMPLHTWTRDSYMCKMDDQQDSKNWSPIFPIERPMHGNRVQPPTHIKRLQQIESPRANRWAVALHSWHQIPKKIGQRFRAIVETNKNFVHPCSQIPYYPACTFTSLDQIYWVEWSRREDNTQASAPEPRAWAPLAPSPRLSAPCLPPPCFRVRAALLLLALTQQTPGLPSWLSVLLRQCPGCPSPDLASPCSAEPPPALSPRSPQHLIQQRRSILRINLQIEIDVEAPRRRCSSFRSSAPHTSRASKLSLPSPDPPISLAALPRLRSPTVEPARRLGARPRPPYLP